MTVKINTVTVDGIRCVRYPPGNPYVGHSTWQPIIMIKDDSGQIPSARGAVWSTLMERK